MKMFSTTADRQTSEGIKVYPGERVLYLSKKRMRESL